MIYWDWLKSALDALDTKQMPFKERVNLGIAIIREQSERWRREHAEELAEAYGMKRGLAKGEVIGMEKGEAIGFEKGKEIGESKGRSDAQIEATQNLLKAMPNKSDAQMAPIYP